MRLVTVMNLVTAPTYSMRGSLLQEYVALVVEKIRSKKGVKRGFGDHFDMKNFKSMPSFPLAYEYAQDYLQKIGEGSSRAAFLLSSKYVLKIAINQKGIAQNEAEMDVFTNPQSKPCVAKVYAADDGYKWVIADLVKPLTSEDEFESLTRYPWEMFVSAMKDYVKKRAPLPKNQQNLNPFLRSVVATAIQNNLLAGDLKEIGHWGKTPDGRCVLLDYGFTGEVYSSHYSDKPRMTGKTAAPDAKTANAVSDTQPQNVKPPTPDEEKTKR